MQLKTVKAITERRCMLRRRMRGKTYLLVESVFHPEQPGACAWAEAADALHGDDFTVITVLAEEALNCELSWLAMEYGVDGISGELDFVWFDCTIPAPTPVVEQDLDFLLD